MFNYITCLYTLLLLLVIRNIGANPDVGSAIEHSADEMRFPNGTVMGKYFYVDAQGNPVNVRYFADDSNYGVELRSMKIFAPTMLAKTAKDQAKIKDRNIEGNIEQKLNDYNNTLNDIMANVYKDQDILKYDEKKERRAKNVDLLWKGNKVKEDRFGYVSNQRIKRKRRDLYSLICKLTGKNAN